MITLLRLGMGIPCYIAAGFFFGIGLSLALKYGVRGQSGKMR